MHLIATSAFGLEAVVARELKELGHEDQNVADGRITFSCDASAICRTNIHLRSADRVLIRIGEFEARDFGALFDQTKALPWSDWLTADAAFPVRGKSVRSQLHSVPDCQSIVKKAIVEHLRQFVRVERLPETGPEFAVEVSILKDRATLTLDTTGPGLHKRGYRTLVGAAPLKETLAAGLIQLSYWNRERPFLDPFCGSGTIAIEAALMARRIAPGVNRSFAAEHWPGTPKKLWDEARQEARDLVTPPLREPLVGSDIDPAAIELARRHAAQAGVADDVRFEACDVRRIHTHRKYGCVIANPPYGERIGEASEIETLYADMCRAFRRLDTWSIYVLTTYPGLEPLMERKAAKRRKLYNARIECAYHSFPGPRPPWQSSWSAGD